MNYAEVCFGVVDSGLTVVDSSFFLTLWPALNSTGLGVHALRNVFLGSEKQRTVTCMKRAVY